jgi:hypothetical protein
LPCPRFANIESVLRLLEAEPRNEDGLPAGIKDLDRKLAEAAVCDVRSLLSDVLSHLAGARIPGAHSYRSKQVLTCVGWIGVRYAYVRGVGASALFTALGVIGKATAAARDRTIRCAALCGSFAEGVGMLKRLCCMDLSTSKLRTLTLQYGQECLIGQEAPIADVRSYPEHQPKEGETETKRTLFCMLDGTGVPCTKTDTAEIKGKNGQAGTRQIRVAVFGEYQWLDKNNRPKCFDHSFSFVVSGDSIDQVAPLVRKHGLARGYGTAPRMQCVADGEETLEKTLRNAFPDAIFTNDFIHACDHLHACCKLLEPDLNALQKEYRFSKGLLYRLCAESAIRRIEKMYPAVLDETSEAYKELDYLRKRKANMCYGKLRKEGLFIASGHVEAAARVIVGRRCKQAGMHWRHNNAIFMSAIIARMRSAA